jgi:hypothetical protein
MENLIIQETPETPEINFDLETGVLKISGRAYSNDISIYYKQLDSWLDEYLTSPKDITIVELHLDYYNSIFHKLLFNFLKKCKTLSENGKKLVINWYYPVGDEDSLDASHHYARTLEYPIDNIETE